jgi:hypothetical protein
LALAKVNPNAYTDPLSYTYTDANAGSYQTSVP